MDVAASACDVDAIVGSSEAMQEVYKAIGRAAPTDATVLVRGESGTGKELVARAIYQHSGRSKEPLLVINCVAIPETLLESELFGYEKGAFTGAANRRIGKIEQANGGTVFLDEIGDMPFSIQAKILRLLQERSIERLGGCEPIPVDVRTIAATNLDLERAIADGRFREDLYYRLKVISIELPPLRDRIADVPQLCDYFLARFSQELDVPNPGITEEAVALLTGHAWPGNVRELANTLQKALIFGRGGPVRAEDVSQAIAGGKGGAVSDLTEVETAIRQWIRETLVSEDQAEAFVQLMDRFTGIVLSEALTLTGGNRSKAAQLLGISRPTLQARIQKHGLKSETTFRPD
jgi:transcriptional regulator with PAS, ATPase and Fis domain